MSYSATRRRPAFTLVEMMVATALIIFMMYILASAFEKALGSFRVLKTAGDMQEKLRSAATILRQDLSMPHFDDSRQFIGGRYVSSQRLDMGSLSPPGSNVWSPPTLGYFRIIQDGIGQPDGLDPDDPTLVHRRSPLPSDPYGHLLQFTVKSEGIRRDQLFSVDTQDLGAAPTGDGLLHQFSYPINNRRVTTAVVTTTPAIPPDAPSSLFTTVWAEMSYFVKPNGQTTDGSVPLYNLYRRQKLLITQPPTVPPLPLYPGSVPKYLDISGWNTSFNGADAITAPMRRFGVRGNSRSGLYFDGGLPRYQDELPAGSSANYPQTSSDLLLTNVLDFAIKVMWEPSTAAPQMPMPTNNPDFPFDLLPVGRNSASGFSNQVRIFDTWSQWPGQNSRASDPDNYVGPDPAKPFWNMGYQSGTTPIPKTIPLKIRVRAIQIELRIWDAKSQTTRQSTIIQDL
jgi:hypothetical protein